MELCQPCKSRGIEKAATRLVPSNGRVIPKCTACYQSAVQAQEICPPAQPAGITFSAEGGKREAAMSKPVNKGIDHAALIADYEAGKTNGEVAEKYGCSTASVSYHLKKAGIVPRSRKGHARPKFHGTRKQGDDALANVKPARIEVEITGTKREEAAQQLRKTAIGNEYSTLIAFLELQRDKIIAAIEALRAL